MAFLKSTRAECISTRLGLPEETAKAEDVVEAGSGDEGEGGARPTRSVVSFSFLGDGRDGLSFLCLFFLSFVWRIREQEKAVPH